MTTTEQAIEHGLADLWDADDPHRAAYDQGFTDGRAAGLAARPPATCHVPVPLPWRHVRPGDVFRSPRGDLWHVAEAQTSGGHVAVRADRAGDTFRRTVDPDDVVHVLHQVDEVDAMTLLADQLGARLIDRRTA